MAVEVLGVKERAPGERRVALTPETARKLAALGATVWIEPGAGLGAGFTDQAYLDAGAQIVDATRVAQADVVLCVQAPDTAWLGQLKQGASIVGMLHPQADSLRAATMQLRSCRSSRWSACRAPPVRSPWMCSVRRPAWPATRRR